MALLRKMTCNEGILWVFATLYHTYIFIFGRSFVQVSFDLYFSIYTGLYSIYTALF